MTTRERAEAVTAVLERLRDRLTKLDSLRGAGKADQ